MSQLIAVGIVGTHHDPVARIPPISPIFHVHRVPPRQLYNAIVAIRIRLFVRILSRVFESQAESSGQVFT